MNAASKYFNEEKIQCTIGIAFAIISICVALYLLIQIRKPFYNGVAYSFMIIPVLLLTICIGVVYEVRKIL